MIKVAICNHATVVSEADVKAAVFGLQIQFDRDYCNAAGTRYGMGTYMEFVYAGDSKPTPDSWRLVIADNADQAGALGYHEDPVSGPPIGYVFVRTALSVGVAWESTLSHEALEMSADPFMLQVAMLGRGDVVPWEICDPVQANTYPVALSQGRVVQMSDFVLPAWFGQDGAGQYSFLGSVDGPFTLAPGGYAVVIGPDGRSVEHVNRLEHDVLEHGEVPHAYTRRARRMQMRGLKNLEHKVAKAIA